MGTRPPLITGLAATASTHLLRSQAIEPEGLERDVQNCAGLERLDRWAPGELRWKTAVPGNENGGPLTAYRVGNLPFHAGEITVLNLLSRFGMVNYRVGNPPFPARGITVLNSLSRLGTDLVTGPGSAILACMATAYHLGIEAEEVCRLLHEEQLVRELTPHEEAWQYILSRLNLPKTAAFELFENRHKICSLDLDIPLPVLSNVQFSFSFTAYIY